ncbi:MAG: hypothetical protein HGA44_11160, partial [Cellulomonadaceae bacterium]|nr:hypothetical protein [Cellulomonadaceae bacterium]
MRTWWGAFRAAGRLARRDATRAKGRTLLVALMVGLPVLAGTAGSTLLLSAVPTAQQQVQDRLGDVAQARIDAYQQPGLEQNADGSFLGFQGGGAQGAPSLGDYEAQLVDALPAGTRLVRSLSGAAHVVSDDRDPGRNAEVLQLPTADIAALAHAQVAAGSLPSQTDEVLLSDAWARALGVGVGDDITVGVGEGARVDLAVSGVLAPARSAPDVIVAEGVLWDTPETASPGAEVSPSWWVLGEDAVTWSHVQAVNALGSVVFSRAVVLNPSEVPDDLAASAVGTAGTAALVGAVAVVALLEAVLLIGPAFAVGARRQHRQLALLAASGAEARTLRHVVLLSGVLTALAASAAAVLTGLGLAVVVRAVAGLVNDLNPFPALRVLWWVLPLLVALGVLVAAGAAWLPARRAARVAVVAALAGRRADPRRRRGLPVPGLVAVATGAVAAVLGATQSQPAVLVGGVLALELGVVAASGALVTFVGRLAPRLGVAGRFALRDAVRQRARTAPAVAAILAAMAGATAGVVYVASEQQHALAQYAPFGQSGTVAVAFDTQPGEHPAVESDALAEATEVLRSELPVAEVAEVWSATLPATSVGSADGGSITLGVERPEQNLCPLVEDGSAEIQRAARLDPRCNAEGANRIVWFEPSGAISTIVDDGTAVRLLGGAAAARAAEALAAGKVVVPEELDLRPDGTVRVRVDRWAEDAAEPEPIAEIDLPAVVADVSGQPGLLLPPSAVEALGLTARQVGLVATTTTLPTEAQEYRARTALTIAAPGTALSVERGWEG